MSQLFSQEHKINVNRLKGTLRSTLLFLKGSLKYNLTPLYVYEDLIQLGLDEPKSQYIGRQWKANFLKLTRAVSGQTLMVNELVDMEWRFGVTSANTELFTVGSTFLQLKLVLNTGNETRNVNMELTLPQFYEFISEMEKARASLETFD
eukprot:TRINITY_DN10865_c0_g1_i1.p1 TRINITY_DN10865_c0_g1~~TRINITY_DN10865_c0_g1_i1.p1  ORF type:complete len:149 (+),score=12.61 TRINITY_DN10865_c0_g1_i1:227-673(+)